MYTNNVMNTFAHFISIGVIIADAVITFCFSQGTFEYNFTDPGEYDVEVIDTLTETSAVFKVAQCCTGF